ncbi:hypothetical protein K438DRAFT_1817238 [Mycena galopus ATCC 62051]|nr:hypothetical protein K438DRAFT_1817238 [Mycena galopus ATCC 62051]
MRLHEEPRCQGPHEEFTPHSSLIQKRGVKRPNQLRYPVATYPGAKSSAETPKDNLELRLRLFFPGGSQFGA